MFSKLSSIISIIFLVKKFQFLLGSFSKPQDKGVKKNFLKANKKFDSCEIFAEVTFAKINSREIPGEAQFVNINAYQMFEKNSWELVSTKTSSLKIGPTDQVSSRYVD